MIQVAVGARTHVGLRRRANEDALYLGSTVWVVADAEIAGVLASHGEPDAAAEALVQAALAGGGADNVTVIVLDVRGEADEVGAEQTIPRLELAEGMGG